MLEDALRTPAEFDRMPLAADREASHLQTVDGLDAGAELVLPADVIARARGDDFDLRVARQPFGDVAGVELRPAVDVGAVSLNDDGELHDSGGPPVVSPGVLAESLVSAASRVAGRSSPGAPFV